MVINDWLSQMFAAIDAVPVWQLYTVAGVMLLLETTVGIGLVVPGEVTLLAVATTVGTAWEYAGLAAVAALAGLGGQSGGYLIGRRFGRRIRHAWVGRRIGEPNWLKAEDVLRSDKARALIGSRFLAVAHSLVPVIAGALRMPAGRFVRYAAIGTTLWSLVYVGLGSAASVVLRKAAHLIGPTFTGVLVVVVVTALVVRQVRRRRREQDAQRLPAATAAHRG